MCRAAILALLYLPVAACADRAGDDAADAALIAQDPVIARALHDPLMSDPDLASRNEANAAIGFADSGALPVFAGGREAASAARESLRIELLEAGPIPDLPFPHDGSSGTTLGPMTSPANLLAAVGAPAGCAERLKEDFALAANLPPVAAIPPRAMLVQAGGADASGCRIRIIRYLSAAPREDVLQYHFTRAMRAGLYARRYAKPGDSIAATGGGGETLVAHVRPAANGLTGVTLVYRAP